MFLHRFQKKAFRIVGGLLVCLFGHSTAQEPALSPGLVTPSTLSVLRMMPDSAVMALGIPPLQAITQTSLNAVSKILPAAGPPEDLVNGIISSAFPSVGPFDIRMLNAFLISKGIAPDQPSAIFLDLSPIAEDAQGVMRACAQINAGGSETQPMQSSPPALVALFGYVNREVAENTMLEVLGYITGIALERTKERAYKETTLYGLRTGWEYGFFSNWLLVANSAALLEKTLDTMTAPMPIRYGSPDCPASASDEIVLLTRPGKTLSLIPDLSPFFLYTNPLVKEHAAVQGRLFSEMNRLYAGDDLLVTTLSITNEKLEFLSRLDLATHPGLAADAQGLKPMRFGGLLSAEDLLITSIRNTPSTRDFVEKLFKFIPPYIRTKDVERIHHLARLSLGDEAVLGFSAGPPPVLRCFLVLQDPDFCKTFLQETLEPTVLEGISTNVWHLPTPVQDVFFILCDNTLIITNAKDQALSFVQSVRAGIATSSFPALSPPVNSADVLTFIRFNTEPLDHIGEVIMGLGGEYPADKEELVKQFSGAFREIRAGKIIRNQWQHLFLSAYFR